MNDYVYKKLTLKKWHFKLNNKWNNLIKGFPGLLNTPGTRLDRSRTIKQDFKKCRKMMGPMTPGNLGPKTIKIFKSLKSWKSRFFLNMEKMRIVILRREHWTRAPDHWYGHFGSKKCFGNLWKSVKSIKIGSILGTSQMVLKKFENLSKHWKILGPSRVPEH